MARATHLWRRGSPVWWRRRWPRDPERPDFLGSSKNQVTSRTPLIPPRRADGAPEQVALSSGTGCPDEAARRARRLDTLFEHAMELRRAMTAGTGSMGVGAFPERWRPLSRVTVWKKQMAIKEIFRDLVEAGVVVRNLMDKVIWTKKQLQTYQKDFADGCRLDRCGRLETLFDTPVFTTKLDDPGDPLSWAPLMAYCGGLRMEEALQLKIRTSRRTRESPASGSSRVKAST